MQAFLALFLAAGVVAVDESPFGKVVSLLGEMLDASKADGEADRDAFAKFKCYCDDNLEEKTTSVANATAEIELMESTLADHRAENQKLSQEVFELKKAMDENEAARAEAQTIRDKEAADFQKEEADLVTGLSQLERAIQLLQAVGADQTQSSGADHEQMMAGAAAAENMGLLAARSRTKLSGDMQQALRAAAVFLSAKQRTKLTAFLGVKSQAPGNYNAQSGEIVGILKSMNDTFTANLENARADEQKAQTEFDGFKEVKEQEFEEMTGASNSKKEQIGTNAEEIATTESEKKSKEEELQIDTSFLDELKPRCEAKSKEYDRRNQLRATEEYAIAQAIALLKKAESTLPSGKSANVKLLQIGVVRKSDRGVRAHALEELQAAARKQHSSRLSRVVAVLEAGNPFDEVLAKIRSIIELIDKEEEEDHKKKAWCEEVQGDNEQNKADKETDLQTLETNLNTLEIAVTQSKGNIEQAEEDLKSNREAQAEETKMRKESHAVFAKQLADGQEAEKIVEKAIEVLTKFYKALAEEQAQAQAEKQQQAEIAMVTRRHALFMKREAEEKAKEHDLFHKAPDLSPFHKAAPKAKAAAPKPAAAKAKALKLLQESPEEGPEFSTGQHEKGNEVIELLNHILEEGKTAQGAAIDEEKSAQAQFETNMQALTEAETSLGDSINQYQLDLATNEKRLEQAHEDKDVTRRELEAIEKYLATIEPGCTFIQTNLQTRIDNRAAEKAALEGAITTLEASPAFANAQHAQELEDLGKCREVCNDSKDDPAAKCQACQHGVSVAGYCATRDAPGCDSATDTESAAAMNAP